MSLKWIAEQLGIGNWKYPSNLLSERPTNTAQAELGLIEVNKGTGHGKMENRTLL